LPNALVTNFYEKGNIGDYAHLLGEVSLLQAAGLNWKAFTFGPEWATDERFLPSPFSLLRSETETAIGRIRRIAQMGLDVRSQCRRAASGIAEYDAVFATGGGYIQSSKYWDSAQRWVHHYSQYALARRANRRFGIFPATLGPFHSQRGGRHALVALRKADWVLCRDRPSLDWAHQNGLVTDLCPDLAFLWSLDRSRSQPTPDRIDRVLVGAMAWGFPNLPSRDRARAAAQYTESLRSLASAVRAHGCSPVLMFQVNTSFTEDRDVRMRGPLEAYYDEVVVPSTPEEVSDLVAAARLVVTSRCHGGIMALGRGTPVITLGYEPKHKWMLELAEIEGRNIDQSEVTPRALNGMLDAVMRALPAETAKAGEVSARLGEWGRRTGMKWVERHLAGNRSE
jgi:polysaccharide pyruvyl transferase WcaK-like protein